MRVLPLRALSLTALLFIAWFAACGPARAAMTADDFVAVMQQSRPHVLTGGERLSGENPRVSEAGGQRFVTWDTGKGRIQLEIETLSDGDLHLRFGFLPVAGGPLPVAASDIGAWGFELPLGPQEYVSGVFERVVDGAQDESWKPGLETAMDLHGQRVAVKVNYTVSAYAPFYLSSENYGLSVDGTWPGVFDFGAKDKDKIGVEFEGPQLGFRFISGPPMRIVQTRSLQAGPVFVPPKWAFGPWRWRDENDNKPRYYNGTVVKAPYNSSVVEDILMLRAFDIPLSAYWIDRPWGPGPRGYDDFEWDPERFPNAQAMLDWLHRNNIAPMVWIAPFVMGDMADFAEQHGYQLQSKPWADNSRQVLVDFSNAEAARWWGENGPAKMARQGVKGFKMDRADGEKLRDDLDLHTSDGRSYRENYNDYPHQYVKAAHDAVQPVLGDDFVLFPRAQYTGSSRYGAMWAGDTGGSEWGLRSAIVALLRCSLMGYPVWGSDTGGYHAADFDQEVFTRWLGFSAFTPIMEVGPTVSRGIWDLPDEPHYNPEVIAALRFYSTVKTELMDYSHRAAEKAHRHGTPIAKPLFLVYPGEPEAWREWSTYLYGDDLLVSPVWKVDETRHKVWLPPGDNWVDLWNGKIHSGGQQVEVDSPLHQVPVFLKQGSDLSLPNFAALWRDSLEIAKKRPDLAVQQENEDW